MHKIHVVILALMITIIGSSCGGSKRNPSNNPQQENGKSPHSTVEKKPEGERANPAISPSPEVSVKPSPAVSPVPSPSPISDLLEFYFLPAAAGSGDGAQLPKWPGTVEAWKAAEKELAGVSARVEQELRFEKVIQIPQPDQPQVFLVVKEQLEGVPIIDARYESFYYDADNARHGKPGLNAAGVVYSRKHGAFFLPLNRVISELKGRVEAGDPRERYEVIFNLELQSKGMRQWTIHFSVDAPLPEIPVKHWSINEAPPRIFAAGKFQVFETRITNALRRDLVAWGNVQTGAIGTVNLVGKIDRYQPDPIQVHRPISTETLRAESAVELDQVEIFTAPLTSPDQLKSVGKFSVSDARFSQPLLPESVTVFRWWGKFAIDTCPNPSRMREAKWIATSRSGPVEQVVQLPENFVIFGKRVNAHMDFQLRVTDANWRPEKSVFQVEPGKHSNLRVARGLAQDFFVTDLPATFTMPAQIACKGMFLK